MAGWKVGRYDVVSPLWACEVMVVVALCAGKNSGSLFEWQVSKSLIKFKGTSCDLSQHFQRKNGAA
jgi:hypothetical protein